MQTKFQRLPRVEVAASEVRGCSAGAAKGDRLATLQRGAPDDAPTADGLVRPPTGTRHVALALAEGKLIAATKMENVANIEVRQTIIEGHAESRYARRAETRYAAAIQQVAGVSHGLGVGVSEEEVQAIGELLFHFGLQPVIGTHTRGGRIAGAESEIEIRHKRLFSHARVRDGSRVVGTRKRLQMTGQRGHVTGLHRHRRR